MSKAAKTTEDKVRTAFARAGGQPGEFVTVISLRYFLACEGLRGTDQDEALAAMFRSREVNLVPQSNQQALTDGQRATALHVGGEAKHLVSVR